MYIYPHGKSKSRSSQKGSLPGDRGHNRSLRSASQLTNIELALVVNCRDLSLSDLTGDTVTRKLARPRSSIYTPLFFSSLVGFAGYDGRVGKLDDLIFLSPKIVKESRWSGRSVVVIHELSNWYPNGITVSRLY